MSNKSLLAIREWGLVKLLLAASGFFAVGAISFLLAVWIQLDTQVDTNPPKLVELSPEKKSAIVHNLNTDQTAQERLKVMSKDLPQPPSSQADPNDASAAAKIKILESLNAR